MHVESEAHNIGRRRRRKAAGALMVAVMGRRSAFLANSSEACSPHSMDDAESGVL